MITSFLITFLLHTFCFCGVHAFKRVFFQKNSQRFDLPMKRDGTNPLEILSFLTKVVFDFEKIEIKDSGSVGFQSPLKRYDSNGGIHEYASIDTELGDKAISHKSGSIKYTSPSLSLPAKKPLVIPPTVTSASVTLSTPAMSTFAKDEDRNAASVIVSTPRPAITKADYFDLLLVNSLQMFADSAKSQRKTGDSTQINKSVNDMQYPHSPTKKDSEEIDWRRLRHGGSSIYQSLQGSSTGGGVISSADDSPSSFDSSIDWRSTTSLDGRVVGNSSPSRTGASISSASSQVARTVGSTFRGGVNSVYGLSAVPVPTKYVPPTSVSSSSVYATASSGQFQSVSVPSSPSSGQQPLLPPSSSSSSLLPPMETSTIPTKYVPPKGSAGAQPLPPLTPSSAGSGSYPISSAKTTTTIAAAAASSSLSSVSNTPNTPAPAYSSSAKPSQSPKLQPSQSVTSSKTLSSSYLSPAAKLSAKSPIPSSTPQSVSAMARTAAAEKLSLTPSTHPHQPSVKVSAYSSGSQSLASPRSALSPPSSQTAASDSNNPNRPPNVTPPPPVVSYSSTFRSTLPPPSPNNISPRDRYSSFRNLVAPELSISVTSNDSKAPNPASVVDKYRGDTTTYDGSSSFTPYSTLSEDTKIRREKEWAARALKRINEQQQQKKRQS